MQFYKISLLTAETSEQETVSDRLPSRLIFLSFSTWQHQRQTEPSMVLVVVVVSGLVVLLLYNKSSLLADHSLKEL